MKFSTEFKEGEHKIGWMNSTFTKAFSSTEFEQRPTPTFQKLPRAMKDAAIESELKPGICELGDVLVFLDNAPEECKDGYFNLFYFPSFVVDVYWDDSSWDVDAWARGDGAWYEDSRVFSPAVSSGTQDSALVSFETSELIKAIEIVKEAGYKIFKEV